MPTYMPKTRTLAARKPPSYVTSTTVSLLLSKVSLYPKLNSVAKLHLCLMYMLCMLCTCVYTNVQYMFLRVGFLLLSMTFVVYIHVTACSYSLFIFTVLYIYIYIVFYCRTIKFFCSSVVGYGVFSLRLLQIMLL